LQELEITPDLCTRLNDCAQSLDSHLFGGDSSDMDDNGNQSVLNVLIGVISRLALAVKNPE
jgi:hypothetical protein